MHRKVLVIATVIAALTITAAASAHDVTFDNKVTGHYANDAFSGKVLTQKATCLEGRQIRIVSVAENGDRTVFASGTTDVDGSYSIPSPDAPEGDYFARVRRVDLRENDKHAHVCGPDASNTFKVKATPAP